MDPNPGWVGCRTVQRHQYGDVVIRAVFFDFGGVLLSSPFEAFASYEVDAGLPDGSIRTINSTNPDDNAWAHLERSDIDLDEFVARFEAEGASLGFRVDGRRVLECLRGELRPAMVDAVARCRETSVTGLLTNNIASMDAATMGIATSSGVADRTGVPGVLSLFDIIVESSKVGVRKPETRFYELACEMAGVEPAEVVFLDDLGVNLKPARTMGMTTIKVDDPDVALAELSAVLGWESPNG